MFTKSNLLGTLVGAVASFGLTVLFFGLLLGSFLDKYHYDIGGLHKDEPSDLLVYLPMILMGFILSTIYGKFKKENHSFMGGFEIGAWVSAFFFLGMNIFYNNNLNHIELTGLIIGGVVGVIMYGIVGGLIALVYKATSK